MLRFLRRRRHPSPGEQPEARGPEAVALSSPAADHPDITRLAPPADARRRFPAMWAHRRPARALRRVLQRTVVFPLLERLADPIEITGQQWLEGLDGPAILAANHPSQLDPVLVVRGTPPHLRERLAIAAAEDSLYRGPALVMGTLATVLLGAFPLPRRGQAEEALARAGAMFEAGKVVLIFPEGRLSPDGQFGRCRTGVARLAAAHGIPVIPIYLDGAYKLNRPARLFRRARVRIIFGAPLHIEPSPDAAPATAMIREAIAALGETAG